MWLKTWTLEILKNQGKCLLMKTLIILELFIKWDKQKPGLSFVPKWHFSSSAYKDVQGVETSKEFKPNVKLA